MAPTLWVFWIGQPLAWIALGLLVRQLHLAKAIDADVFARSLELAAREMTARLGGEEAAAILVAEALAELASICRQDEPGPDEV